MLKLRESQTAKGGELEGEADAVREMQGNVRAAEESLLSQQQLEHVRHIQLQTQAALAKRLVAAARGEYQPAASAAALEDRIAEADDTAAWLLTVVESLSQEHPHFAPSSRAWCRPSPRPERRARERMGGERARSSRQSHARAQTTRGASSWARRRESANARGRGASGGAVVLTVNRVRGR